jgi:hypothetical protein
MPSMKTIWLLSVILCCSAGMWAQDIPKLHKFQLWNTFTSNQKLVFITGFTNGLLAGAGLKQCTADKPSQALLKCIVTREGPSIDQAIAMVDKYYKENPEKWSVSIGDAMVEALAVKGGPCAGMAAQK